MSFYADPRQDLPSPIKPKRVIFYAQGLKIYGQIPYILARRLGAKFYSNNMPILGSGRIIAPSGEPNYTVVPYRREDGQLHSEKTMKALLEWLKAGKGFEWAVADEAEFFNNICTWTAWNRPPKTWVPGNGTSDDEILPMLSGHLQLLEDGDAGRSET